MWVNNQRPPERTNTMNIKTKSGKYIKVTYFGAQRKMARKALDKGDNKKAANHFKLIRNGKRMA